MSSDLFERISKNQDRLTSKCRKVGQYVLSNFEEASLENVTELAKKAGVSEATVMRFVRALGYRGFPQFKDECKNVLLAKLSPTQRMQRADVASQNLTDLVASIYEQELKNMAEVYGDLAATIEPIAKQLLKKERVYVMGMRTTGGPAFILGHALSQIAPNIVPIMVGDSSMFETIKSVNEKCAVICFSFPRYVKASILAMRFAKSRRAMTVAVTNSRLSPAAQLADYALIAPSTSRTFALSYTAAISATHALLAAIAHLNQDRAKRYLREMDESLKGLGVFYQESGGHSDAQTAWWHRKSSN